MSNPEAAPEVISNASFLVNPITNNTEIIGVSVVGVTVTAKNFCNHFPTLFKQEEGFIWVGRQSLIITDTREPGLRFSFKLEEYEARRIGKILDSKKLVVSNENPGSFSAKTGKTRNQSVV